MCFLALAYKTLADYAVVVAANRDEFLDRPGAAPQRIRQGIVGGVDLQAGGTWLAVSARGLVAAVTNIGLERPRAEARSRGLLCLDASELAHADAAPELLRAAVAADPYGPFNLLVADARPTALAALGAQLLRECRYDEAEKYLAEGKQVRVKISFEQGQPQYEIKVT